MSAFKNIPEPEPFVWEPGRMISNIEHSIRQNHHGIVSNYTFVKELGSTPQRADFPQLRCTFSETSYPWYYWLSCDCILPDILQFINL